MSDTDPLAPPLKTDPAPKASTPPAEPKGGSFEESIRSLKELKPEQQDAILSAHKSVVDAGIRGARNSWEESNKDKITVADAQKMADEAADKRVKAYAQQSERTTRNREIATEEFGITLRGKDGKPTDAAKEMKTKLDETCKRLGINPEIALATDEGLRGLLIACGYKSKVAEPADQFGPGSGLPVSVRSAAAAAAAKPADKRDAWDDYDVAAAGVIQSALGTL